MSTDIWRSILFEGIFVSSESLGTFIPSLAFMQSRTACWPLFRPDGEQSGTVAVIAAGEPLDTLEADEEARRCSADCMKLATYPSVSSSLGTRRLMASKILRASSMWPSFNLILKTSRAHRYMHRVVYLPLCTAYMGRMAL